MISSVKYKDVYRPELNTTTAINTVAEKTDVTIAPNPAVNGKTIVSVPASWKNFSVQIFDMQARLVATFVNTTGLDLSALPGGNYIARVVSGTNTAFVKISK